MYKDRVVGMFCMAFCALAWLYLIPQHVKGDAQAVYPYLVIMFLFVPSLLMALFPRAASGLLCLPTAESWRQCRPVYGLMALYAVYIVGVQYIGFFSVSIVFSCVYLYYFGERRAALLLGMPLGLAAAVYLVITHFLNFPLPAELLF